MKNLIVLILLSTLNHIAFSEVTGHAFLEDQTDHSGIKIKFIPYSPTAQLDSTYTSISGYYNISIEPGVYTIEYSKEEYLTQFYNQGNYVTLYGNEFLIAITLMPSSGNYMSGSISGTWTNENIYFIVGDVYIPNGLFLIIEEGTVIKLYSSCNFEINGTLQVNGTEQNPVLFTAYNDYPVTGDWGYLDFYYSYNSYMNHCIIEYGSEISINHSNVNISYSEIKYFTYGIYCTQSIPYLDYNVIQNCNDGIIQISYCNNFSITNNDLIANQLNYNFKGIYVFDAHGLIENNKIIGNTISSNDNYAIYIDNLNGSDTLFISNNIIYHFENGIYSVINDKLVVINNVIHSNYNYGISIPSGKALIQSNCITNNYIGLKSLGNFSNIEISYNNIWNNQTNIISNIPGLGQIITTNNNGDPCDPYFNISLDPLFVDTANFNFHFYEGSPVIDAGDNDNVISEFDFDGNPRILDGNGDGNAIVDMGVYEVAVDFIPTSNFTCNDSVCMNENATIQYLGNANDDAIYFWDFDGGIVTSGTGQGPYQVYWLEPGYKTISLYVLLEGLYSDTTYHDIQILQNPEQAGTPSGPTDLCQGSQNIQYNTSGALYADSYQWDVIPSNAVTSISGNTTSAIIDWALSYYGLANVSVYGVNECGDGIVSESFEVNIEPGSIVSVTVGASVNPICIGDEVIFTAYPVNGGNSPSFLWKVNGTGVGTNSPVYITSGLVDNDQVYCYMLSSYCQSQGWIISNFVVMDVYNYPDVTIGALPNDTACITETITLDAGSGDSYLWSTGQTSPYIVVSNTSGPSGGNQTYSVEVTNGGICSGYDTISVYFDPCTGVYNSIGISNMSIFPNPSKGEFYLQLGNLDKEVYIKILSSQGIILDEFKCIITATNSPYKISIADYPIGIYFIKIQNEDVFEVQKIIRK